MNNKKGPQAIGFPNQLFPSKASLTRAIQAEVKPYTTAEVFQSDLLSELAIHRHPYCRRYRLQPTHFRKNYPQFGRSGYHFEAYFENIGWRAFSWHKCVDQPTFHDEVQGFLRWNIVPLMIEAKLPNCENCGSSKSLEAHHEEPTFAQMYAQASVHFTPDEIDLWAFYNWDGVPGFRLPPDHPVFKSFMALHENGQIQTFCTPCHRRITNARKIS